MKIFRDLKEYDPPTRPTVTIGTFDGVHTGHQKILDRLQTLAGKKEGETVLITFWPHPKLILQPKEHNLRLINTMDEKIDLLRRKGIDNLLMIPFSQSFAEQTKEQFIKDILIENVQTHTLIAGYDHRFGKNREGSFEDLEAASHQYGFHLEEIPAHTIDDSAVSSTKIRNALAGGDIETANTYLGYPFFLTGTVTEGDRIGNQIGFPTANLKISEEYKLIPSTGVYAVWVKWKGNIYEGMMNIGYRPTVEGKTLMMEVNIFDFNEDIYGEEIRVFLLERQRPEVSFSGLDELKEQLKVDKENTLKFFNGSAPDKARVKSL